MKVKRTTYVLEESDKQDLEKIMKAKGLSYRSTAKLLGISYSYLDELFIGKRPISQERINQILEVLEQ